MDLKILELYRKSGLAEESEHGYPKLKFIRHLTKFVTSINEAKDKDIEKLNIEIKTREEMYSYLIEDTNKTKARMDYLVSSLEKLSANGSFGEIEDELQVRIKFAKDVLANQTSMIEAEKIISAEDLISKIQDLSNTTIASIEDFNKQVGKYREFNKDEVIGEFVKMLVAKNYISEEQAKEIIQPEDLDNIQDDGVINNGL
jgi:hypothetical protein